ncbi:MAG: response regulator transcription factor [Clostridia bacterium]|nr:response regulator transcription factor [Clostridia bacterium]
MANILIVEDNSGLRRLLSIHLRRAGYEVYEAGNGVEALGFFDRVGIHLIIADIMMPEMDGFELTKTVRSGCCDVPILIITAKDSLEDKRTGFHSGADDYMTKPIDPEELLLRVEALLRRYNMNVATTVTVGKTTLNADALQVIHDGKIVELRRMEYLLLQTLLSSPMKIFTRQMLMDEVWGYDSESDPRTVDTHIKRLREKLAFIDDFSIITIRGLGYKTVINKDGKDV